MSGPGREPRQAADWATWLIPAAVVAWLIYDINGFRPPWSPIIVADADSGSGLRQLLFSISAGLALWSLFVSRRLGRELARQSVVVALGLGLVATLLYTQDTALTIKRAAIFNMGVLTLLGLLAVTRSPIRQMQRIVVCVTGAAAWLSIIGLAVLPAAAVSLAERPGLAGVSGHPNTLSPCLVVGWIVSLGMVSTGRERVFLNLARAGQLIAIFLTNSISSIVLLLVAWTLFTLLEVPSYRRGVMQLLIVAATTAVLLVGPQAVKSGALQTAGRDESLSGRDQLWHAVWQEGLKSPIFGSGYGAFWYEGRGREIVGSWNPRQSHNAYVDLFVDLGVVGLAMVLLVFGGGAWSAWIRVRDKTDCPRRRAFASMLALTASMLLVYAFGESFLLKLDKMPMFCLLWFRLLMTDSDDQSLPDQRTELIGADAVPC